jgi:hypothetical protein
MALYCGRSDGARCGYTAEVHRTAIMNFCPDEQEGRLGDIQDFGSGNTIRLMRAALSGWAECELTHRCVKYDDAEPSVHICFIRDVSRKITRPGRACCCGRNQAEPMSSQFMVDPCIIYGHRYTSCRYVRLGIGQPER